MARAFLTLDHLSRGRVAWNVVTSMNDGEALNFGLDTHLDHDTRYDRADEFMELTAKLWDSWAPDALVLDQAGGIYARPDRVRDVDHVGPWFRSRGPLNIPPGPQGRPVIIQAGASDRGLAFAARWAEVVFTIGPTVDDLCRYTDSLRAEMSRIGRSATACQRYGQGVLVAQLCGTGAEVASQLVELFDGSGIDGFVISPALLPASFEAFVDAVVPELQRRGRYRTDYEAGTLRGHLQE